MGAAPHPALRATFPRRVKASAAVEKFPAKAQTFRARPFRPLRRSRASSPKGGAKPLSLDAKVLGAMRKLPAVLLALPLRKDFPRSGGRCHHR